MKNSPHPNCAKLWIEHILSDEGALGYLQGGAMPALVFPHSYAVEKALPVPFSLAKEIFAVREHLDAGGTRAAMTTPPAFRHGS